jgi:hypothetical protein
MSEEGKMPLWPEQYVNRMCQKHEKEIHVMKGEMAALKAILKGLVAAPKRGRPKKID